MSKMVQVKVERARIDQKQTSLLVIGVCEDEKEFPRSEEFDPAMSSTIKQILENKEFKGSFGSSLILHIMHGGLIKKIMLIGLGKREKFTNESARIIAGQATLRAKELVITEFSIVLSSILDIDLMIEAISEGIYLSVYSFNKYKTNSKEKEFPMLNKVTVLVKSESTTKLQSIADKVGLIVEAVNFARDLSNLPPNECSPSQLASLALSVASEYSIKARVVERYEMESIGLDGIVAVGKGSNNPPKMIILEYHGAAEDQKPYLLVGKAVTFDTGGISLKPGDKMDEMKYDKCGGCTVLGVLKSVASLKLPVNIVCIIPSVENMPSSSSYRPGDIIKMYNGKTVEVLNTDAEGRMILADALGYGIATYNPKAVIDLATLTGACIIALGANVAAVIGTNRHLIDILTKISEQTGEKMWELPLFDEFQQQIKSTVADIKNIGGRPGGAITAAAFLSNFCEGFPWIHLDIAGTAWTQEGTYERSYNPKGATGFGIRTLVKLFEEDNTIKI
jgi:leucyl aminopeptidase